MPYRYHPIIKGEIYHVFNRSVAKQPIFAGQRNYQRALDLIHYYRYIKPRLRFSHYNRLPLQQRSNFFDDLIKNGKKHIELYAFCLMPNHVHFLLQETIDDGIPQFMRNFQNGYAKYFNIKSDRTGALFQSMFKAVRIETDEQLIHVTRYIHLNPLTSYLVKNKEDLERYQWSSFPHYLQKEQSDLVNTDLILEFFSSREEFKKFTLDQADYQRKLDEIKHLLLE